MITKKNNIFLIEGNKTERDKALSQIKKSLSSYELYMYDSTDSIDVVSHAVKEYSCFGEKRLFIINELPKIISDSSKKEDSKTRSKVINILKKTLPSIPPSNILIFNNVGISATSFHKEVEKFGRVLTFNTTESKQAIISFVLRHFNQLHIECSRDLAKLLVDSFSPDNDIINKDEFYLLIKKLENYLYGKKKVDQEDVYAICSNSPEFVVWTLYEHLDRKDYATSFKVISDYLKKVKYLQVELNQLFYGMRWRYGLFLLCQSGLKDGLSKQDIQKQISKIYKLESSNRSYKMVMNVKRKDTPKKSDVLGEPIPEYSDKMVWSVLFGQKSSLNKYSYNHLSLIYYTLLKAIVRLRTGCRDFESLFILQTVFLVICNEITQKNIVDGLLRNKKELWEI